MTGKDKRHRKKQLKENRGKCVMKYAVVDLEMCRVPKSMRTEEYRWSMETIQIGAVLLDEDFNVYKKFSTFVRPEYGRMDPFIERLTGITKENVYTARTFAEAIDGFLRWLKDYDVRCVSWSYSDENQIRREIEAKGIDNARLNELLDSWIDCQKIFDEKMDSERQYSLEEALIASDIITEGRAHDGLVDAYNTALLYSKLMTEPEYELNEIYSHAREDRVEHLGVCLGDMFGGLKLQLAAG